MEESASALAVPYYSVPSCFEGFSVIGKKKTKLTVGCQAFLAADFSHLNIINEDSTNFPARFVQRPRITCEASLAPATSLTYQVWGSRRRCRWPCPVHYSRQDLLGSHLQFNTLCEPFNLTRFLSARARRCYAADIISAPLGTITPPRAWHMHHSASKSEIGWTVKSIVHRLERHFIKAC